MILSLQSEQSALDTVGGKGANLSKLARAGYPVPDGFLITTDAYLTYVAANNLRDKLLDKLTGAQTEEPGELQEVSQTIRDWFSEGRIPADLSTAILGAYANLGAYAALERLPVAVRSSATAEDLPEMSFAGQLDTFLNVLGEEALLKAVVNCWSSLWTARAIGYRARYNIPHQDVALAVVVQEMVQPEASGVLFTANPLTGVRAQVVIDATLGLGEALVSGQVEPDHYVVNAANWEISSKTLGAKAIATRSAEGGGVITVQEDAGQRQALPDGEIVRLARLGRRVADDYGFPQDIEWAWAGEQLYLLQSRPITALYPLPAGMEPEPLRVLVSFAAVQGIMEPFTPLGQDTIQLIFAGGGDLFGYQATIENQQAVRIAGERLWIDVTGIAHNAIGQKIMPRGLALAEPAAVQAMAVLWADPRLKPKGRGIRLRTAGRIARFMLPFWRNVLKSLRHPEQRRAYLDAQIDQRLATLQAKSDATAGSPDAFARRVDLVYELRGAFPFAIPDLFSSVAGGMIPLVMLNRLAGHVSKTNQEGRNLALEISRGLPHNVTTEMDLSLWQTAQTIRTDPPSAQCFLETDAQALAVEYLSAQLPDKAQKAVAQFLERYGVRGLGEIDIGRPRWRQAPAHIMQTLQSYLRITDEAQAPDVVFQRGAQAAQAAGVQLQTEVRNTRGGWLKARMVGWATHRFRSLAGLRESPKFFIVRMMDIIHQGLLESGQDLVAEGTLDQPEDVFFLHLSELEALANGESRDWAGLIADRRKTYEREKLRRQIPRLLLGDGQAFYEGLSITSDVEQDVLVGSPVSPGVAEGLVRVIRDPHSVQLNPGEILVCPGTDPAWTPLFLAAGGLVMEVGGLMTHGSVVAREYGIPAVVGVHQATQQLKTGQRIQVDGNTGRIVRLES